MLPSEQEEAERQAEIRAVGEDGKPRSPGQKRTLTVRTIVTAGMQAQHGTIARERDYFRGYLKGMLRALEVWVPDDVRTRIQKEVKAEVDKIQQGARDAHTRETLLAPGTEPARSGGGARLLGVDGRPVDEEPVLIVPRGYETHA